MSMATPTASDSSAAAAATTTTMNDSINIASSPDTVVFGSMAFKIADDLCEAIDAALVEGVASLPGDDNASVLLHKLRHSYFRNVDVLESYLVRNIFTLDNASHHKTKIVQAYMNGTLTRSSIAKENTTFNVKNTHVELELESFHYPSKNDIPSCQELQRLQQDLLETRNRLRAARRRRNDLLAKLEHLASAHQAVEGVRDSLSTANPSHETIKDIVMSKDRLEQLHSNAASLVRTLEDAKHNRHDDYDDDDEQEFNVKKQKLSLEQQYKEQRSTTKTQGSLEQVRKLLQE